MKVTFGPSAALHTAAADDSRTAAAMMFFTIGPLPRAAVCACRRATVHVACGRKIQHSRRSHTARKAFFARARPGSA
jgi:hypothetical protein